MNESSEFNPQLDISSSAVDGQVAQAAGDVTQIQLKNVTFNKTQIIQISVAEIKTRPFKPESPYQGLDFFDRDDQDYFFGRDQFLTGLVHELEQANLILLLGASGSGKSSVVRAGLIPWLVKQRGTKLTTLVFTPNQDPFESFYASLLIQNYKQSAAQLVRSGKADVLTQALQTLKQPESDWFIFIDQFEELFPAMQSDRRKAFIAGLVRLSRANLPGVKIMMAMRADFLDRLSPYPEFIQLTDHHRPMIAEMRRDELRLAIEQPAAHHGVVFEEGLVEEIIKDVQGQAGYLPLLQYALDLLWETEQKVDDRTLKIGTYRTLGGIRGALQQRIDQIYIALTGAEQSATQRIFLRLVGIGGDEESETDWKPIRRRANREEFSDPLEQVVLAQLIDEKLLVSDRQPHTQQSTVELAHEVILSSWTMLNDWIRENRQAIALRNRLNDDVDRWQVKKDEEELWSGSKLEQALELRRDSNFNQVLGGFDQAANQFIDASLGKRDRQRRRLLAGVVAFGIVIAGSGVGFGIQQQREKQTVEAVFLSADAPTPTLLDRLPGFLEAANRRRAKIDRFKKQDNPDQAFAHYHQNQEAFHQVFAYYRKILTVTNRLQKQDQLKQNAEIQTIREAAEKSLAEMFSIYRIPQLKKELENKQYSVVETEKRGIERFTPGDLRTVYQLLMLEAGADLDGNDQLQTLEEAEQIPCVTLEEIENLWKKTLGNQCGWYLPDASSGEFAAPECQHPKNYTLSFTLFSSPGYESVIDRIKHCRTNQFKNR